ncbi:glutamine cyclotransferase [Bacteroidetes bacterium SCGC AAA795-G10]|nr:glutamine cyclotransferase [Bacteroidetes bacterium SCGC AAA795-G10]
MKFFLNIIISILILNCNSNAEPKIQILTGVKGNKGSFEKVLNLVVKTSLEDFDTSYYLNNRQIEKTHKFLEKDPLGEYNIRVELKKGDKIFKKNIIYTLLSHKPPKLYKYEIVNIYSHDIEAYTQGLEFDGEDLYESTGLNGKSTLRKVNYKTGEIIENKKLDDAFFGEGITLINDKIIQLTWKSLKGFVYRKTNLEMIKSFPYFDSKEGWGLCNDGNKLYKSDGSENIWILNPNDFKEESRIQVVTNKSALRKINELEWVSGKIYANTYQFQKDVVVIINPVTGSVDGVIDFSGLKEKVKQHTKLNVLNGIAYHKKRKTLFVTGKNWNKMFEVKILSKD